MFTYKTPTPEAKTCQKKREVIKSNIICKTSNFHNGVKAKTIEEQEISL